MEATKTELGNKTGPILRAALREPVMITAHGNPSHVLVSIEQWEEMLRIIEDAQPDAGTSSQAENTTT